MSIIYSILDLHKLCWKVDFTEMRIAMLIDNDLKFEKYKNFKDWISFILNNWYNKLMCCYSMNYKLCCQKKVLLFVHNCDEDFKITLIQIKGYIKPSELILLLTLKRLLQSNRIYI